MTTTHEDDYRRRVGDVAATRFLPGSTVEIIHEVRLPAPPKFAVFDFDGTLSLVREGWPEVMVPMMVEELAATGTKESPETLGAIARDFVAELTGKQTIYQMIRLAEEIEKRGGTPQEPVAYKHRYHDLLMERITGRREALRNGTRKAEEMLVPYSIEILEGLIERDVTVYLASGTDENFVREEAELLGLGRYFGRHIYGAQDNYKDFSKAMVIERILRENNVEGSRLVGFGDGYVEIDNIKAAGGTAVAVASDETNRSGRPDPWKRDRLIGVGADIVIPDFRDYAVLLRYLWREGG
jgi:phosphoglycolate phosphatase-like HAD superfamily hydrolase